MSKNTTQSIKSILGWRKRAKYKRLTRWVQKAVDSIPESAMEKIAIIAADIVTEIIEEVGTGLLVADILIPDDYVPHVTVDFTKR